MGKERRKRMTKKDVEILMIWLKNPVNSDIISNSTAGRIREIYFKETGTDVSEITIKMKMKKDYTIIDGIPVSSYLLT